MSLKLITEHKDYLLLVDTIDHNVKVFEYAYDNRPESKEKIVQVKAWTAVPINNGIKGFAPQWDKIIAASPKLGDLPLLPEIEEPHHPDCPAIDGFVCHCDELPKHEEDVEQPKDYYPPKDLAATIWGNCFDYKSIDEQYEGEPIRERVKGACFGAERYFKAASKKWTDEDMIRFGAFMQDRHVNSSESFGYFKSKFLSPTLVPIGFEPEYELVSCWGADEKLKVVNNILQGTYKFKE